MLKSCWCRSMPPIRRKWIFAACGPTASRHAEVLSFRRLGERVLSITGGIAQVTLDAGGKLMTMQKALLEVAPSPAGLPAPLPEGGIFCSSCWI